MWMILKDNSYISGSYFSDEGDSKTIYSIVLDKLLDNPASLEPLYVNSDAEFLQEKHKKNYIFT